MLHRKTDIITSTRLFVGNLSFKTTQDQLQAIFAAHGVVNNVDMIMDKFSGRPRGFAFVTMEAPEGAEIAIGTLNGKNVDGRDLTVNLARPREDRPDRDNRGERGPRSYDDRG